MSSVPITSTRIAHLAIGELVRSRRLEMGLSQSDLASLMRRMGYTVWVGPTVCQVEMSNRHVKVRELWALSLLLGFEIADVFPSVEGSLGPA